MYHHVSTFAIIPCDSHFSMGHSARSRGNASASPCNRSTWHGDLLNLMPWRHRVWPHLHDWHAQHEGLQLQCTLATLRDAKLETEQQNLGSTLTPSFSKLGIWHSQVGLQWRKPKVRMTNHSLGTELQGLQGRSVSPLSFVRRPTRPIRERA